MPSTHPQPITAVTPVVGTTSVQVIGSNPSRLGLFVFNPNSAGIISVCGPEIVSPAISGQGTITVLAGQGVQLDGWTTALFAIGSVSGLNISVMEFS